MPAASTSSTFNKAAADIAILNNFVIGARTLQSQHQYLIAEVVMLRLFGIFESTVEEVAFRLACNARYRNGNAPRVLLACRSVSDAHTKMLSHGRRQPLRFLRWTTSQYISDSIRFVLDTADVFYMQIVTHSASLDEMRIVRNQIAHRTPSTKREFDRVLVNRYGANPRLSMGAYLTATTRHQVPNITRYLQTMGIILNDITAG